jgi:hypothetical protein
MIKAKNSQVRAIPLGRFGRWYGGKVFYEFVAEMVWLGKSFDLGLFEVHINTSYLVGKRSN